jgi:hypothetical protein
MKVHYWTRKRIRTTGRRKVRTSIGPRLFIFFLIMAVACGALAFSVNERLEEWEHTHHEEPP